MPTRIQKRESDHIAMTLGLTLRALPEKAKGIQGDVERIASLGANTLAKIAEIEDNQNLSPAGKRDAKRKVYAEAAPAIRKFRSLVQDAERAVDVARREAIAVPPEKPGALVTDSFMLTQIGKLSPQLVQQRYIEGLSGDPKGFQVVRCVRAAREAGIPVMEPAIQDLFDSKAYETSEARDRVDAQEMTAGFLKGITSTVTTAVREVAKDDGLEPELQLALEAE